MLGWAGVTGASLGTAATASGAETPLALGLGVGASALQLGKEVYTTLKLMKEPRFDARAPLAYAALASRL
jgi:predicted O-methyltransferase YrrM